MPSSRSSSITANLDDLLQGKSLLGHGPGEKRKVSIVNMTPVPGSKQIVVNAQAIGTKMYVLTMSLFGMEYSKTKTTATPLPIHIGENDYLFTKSMPIKDTKVQVRCSCPDFYYTWSWWDKENKALAGPPMKPYVRKTDTYPERNHAHVPGCCKHLVELTNRLIGLGILKK